MKERSTIVGVGLWVVILLSGLGMLLGHNAWWTDFISTSFSNKGEDYYQSIGAVLRENWGKGLLLYTAEPFTFWLILTITLLSLLPAERITTRLVMGIAGVFALYALLYVGFKTYDFYAGTFDNKNRIVAIGSRGISRAAGIALGCWIAQRVDLFGRLTALLQRSKYQSAVHRLS
jgi:hypothetical protein